MKRIISLALLALGMHVSMHAEELVIADKPVKAVACWFGTDALGLSYETYCGELTDDAGFVVAMCCVDSKNHTEYACSMFPVCQKPEGETSQEVFEKLAAYHREHYDAERYELTNIDGKAYRVNTIVPKDASAELKAIATEKFNIKVAFQAFTALIKPDFALKGSVVLNIKNIDESGVINQHIRYPNCDLQGYIGKDQSTGALIVAAAPQGLACMAEVILIHERTEEVRCIPPYSWYVYPVEPVENAEEVYTALQKRYNESFAAADRFGGAIRLIAQ